MRPVCVLAFVAVLVLLTGMIPHPQLSRETANVSSGVGPPAMSRPVESTISGAATYLVTIAETGLPNGTNWTVSLDEANRSSTSSTVTFTEPNGTYQLYTWDVRGYTSYSNLTSVSVRGIPVRVTVSYTPPLDAGYYYVTFEETGLPFNLYWTVEFCAVVNGTENCGMGQNFFGPTHDPTGVYGVPNGTFDWQASLSNITESPIAHNVPFPSQGQVVVNGSSLMIDLTFRFAYPSWFDLQGVSSSTSWSFQILNETFTGRGGGEFVIDIPNGTYDWIVGAHGYYSVSGNVTVQVAEVANVQTITLTALPPPPLGHEWVWLTVGLVALVAIVCLALFVRRRRRDEDPPFPPQSGDEQETRSAIK